MAKVQTACVSGSVQISRIKKLFKFTMLCVVIVDVFMAPSKVSLLVTLADKYVTISIKADS